MSCSVRPNYVNPLTTMGQSKNHLALSGTSAQQGSKAQSVKNLQLQRQTLQNQIILMKSTTEGSAASADSQKAMEKQLEEVSAELQTAKSQAVSDTGTEETMTQAAKPSFDSYTREAEQSESPGLYQVLRDGENKYHIKIDGRNLPKAY